MTYPEYSDDKWLEMLLTSVDESNVEGIEFPSFPPPQIQAQFVGSAYKPALVEAYNFYKLFKEHQEIRANDYALDFGCGWGRFLRFLRKDYDEMRLLGVDIDPDILEICRETGVSGSLTKIEPRGPLPYEDGQIDSVIAYSVFTHLPEEIHLHWMKELARVTRRGAIVCLTLESPRFVDFIAGLAGQSLESPWHIALANYAGETEKSKALLDRGEIVYFPTGGGKHRGSDVYGDAVVPLKYIEKNWVDFEVLEYLDDPARFWQAALVLRKK